MLNKKILLIGCYASLSTSLFAGTMGVLTGEAYQPVATLSMGPAWSNSGDTQTFYLQPFIRKTFSAAQNTSTLLNAELFLGYQRSIADGFLGQLGFAFAADGNARLGGDIWENADPRFNNSFYAYKANHLHIAVKGKALTDRYDWVQPYVSGSLGVGFNHAYNFKVIPKIYEEVPQPAFDAYTNTAFTYTAGAGFQTPLNSNWQTGIGYEFTDWGKTNLRRAPGQTLGHGLRLNHLYTHQLQISLTYLA